MGNPKSGLSTSLDSGASGEAMHTVNESKDTGDSLAIARKRGKGRKSAQRPSDTANSSSTAGCSHANDANIFTGQLIDRAVDLYHRGHKSPRADLKSLIKELARVTQTVAEFTDAHRVSLAILQKLELTGRFWSLILLIECERSEGT